MADDSLLEMTEAESVTYEPPRALRLGGLSPAEGNGFCSQPGSGNVVSCATGNGAVGEGCSSSGNDALAGACVTNGAGASGGNCVDQGSSALAEVCSFAGGSPST